MSQLHRREQDRTKLGRWYSRRIPQVHLAEIITLGVLLFGAIGAWVTQAQTVNNLKEKTEIQEAHLDKLDQAIAAQAAIAARIEQKVDYVREDTKAMRRER